MDSRKDSHKEAEELRADGLSWTEIADTLEVSRSTVWRWRKSGKVEDTAPQDGTSDVATRNGNRSTNGGAPTLQESRARKEAALARKHELDAAERTGELVTRDHVRDLNLRYRSAIEAIPRVLLSDVTELLGLPQREVLPLLEEIVDAVKGHVVSEIKKWPEVEADDED